MSKQRALELCDLAERNPGPNQAWFIIEAIRELAKDEPDLRLDVAAYLKNLKPEWAMSYCEAVADDLIRIWSNRQPPKSDPPAPA